MRSAAGGDPLRRALAEIVGGDHVLVGDGTNGFIEDWTGAWRGRAQAVVRPADAEEVAAALLACASAGVGVVPQGGNTGLVGGSVPGDGEVVLSLRRLTTLGEVTADGLVEAGAGVTLAALQRHSRAAGWEAGTDLAARDRATVGGMIATNAGGLEAGRHGRFGERVRAIQTANVQEYPLRGELLDVRGMEGTLAVITSATVQLVERADRRATALVGCASVEEAAALVARLKATTPELFAAELMLRNGMALVGGPTDHPVYLLIETTGDPEALDFLLDAQFAVDAAQRARLWAYRKNHTEAIARTGGARKLDVVVPLDGAQAIIDTLPQDAIVFGHALTGNLHLNLRGDEPPTDTVLQAVENAGGDPIGEHGAGRAKQRWVTPDPVWRERKRALDPRNLLNPGVRLG